MVATTHRTNRSKHNVIVNLICVEMHRPDSEHLMNIKPHGQTLICVVHGELGLCFSFIQRKL